MFLKLKEKRVAEANQEPAAREQFMEDFKAEYLTVLQDMDRAAEQIFLVKSVETQKREQNDKALYQLIQADADIDFCKEQIGELYALLDLAELELSQTMVGGKNQVKQQKQVITLKKQINSAETRLRKAQFCKYAAERRLYAGVEV